MIYRLAPITWMLKVSRAIDLWHVQAQILTSSLPLCPFRAPHHSLSVQQPFSHRFVCLKWKHFQKPQIHGRKEAKLLLRLHTKARRLNTSTSRWSAGLRQYTSNIRSILTELLSKIARLKPNASQASKGAETSVEVKSKAKETINVPTVYHEPPNATCTSTPTSSVSTGAAATPGVSTTTTTTTSVPDYSLTQATEPAPPTSGRGKKLWRTGPAVREKGATRDLEDTKPPSSNGSETTQPSHPSTSEKKVDNDAKSSTSSQGEEEQTSGDLVSKTDKLASEPAATSAPSSPKKGIGQSAQSVQNFLGSYIAPLVPKFRATESGGTAEKSEDVLEKRSAEATVTEEQKPTEEKGKQATEATVTKQQKATEKKGKNLRLQRERIIDRAGDLKGLVHSLQRDSGVYVNMVEDLSSLLMEFPDTHGVAVKENVIPYLLHLRQEGNPDLRAAVSQALNLVGYNDPVKGRGIRILTIDGGGSRGLVALQTLHRLESLTGKPIYQLFDYICGVSTGALLGFMLGVYQLPVNKCDEMYRELGPNVFKQNVIIGTMKMGWSHAYYNTETWEKTLKELMGTDRMVETSRNPKCPKVAAVSTIVNRGTPLKAYVFRNYNFLPGVHSSYLGGCQHQLWQAIRASTAAPGYFQELTLGDDIHQDGGLLMNNPTALAIHECQRLWPGTPVECVVSVGTDHFITPGKQSATSTSLKTKLVNILSSATDTEVVHAILMDLLPPDTYFRFNPYMSEGIEMDESRREKLDLLLAECSRYLDLNDEKMKRAALILTREKGSIQRLVEWARLKYMFNMWL